MDEKLMVMEQDRLEKEKKKKKTRKKVRIVGAVVLVLAVVGVWYLGWGRHLGEEEEQAVQIAVSAGQEVVYADLTSVKGNEITYRIAQEMQTTEEATNANAEGIEGRRRSMRSEGRISDMGEMPELSGQGETLWRGRGGMGMMNQIDTSASDAEIFAYNGVEYEITEETVTTIIPVGTDVTTKLGTVTTFSRLAAGDKVALVVEEQDGEQIIIAVYIID